MIADHPGEADHGTGGLFCHQGFELGQIDGPFGDLRTKDPRHLW
jgi:hypothetical protein